MSKRSAGDSIAQEPKRSRSDEEIKYRLPDHITPSEYHVTIWPDIPAAQFDGYVEIALNVTSPTAAITMHSLELDFALENCTLTLQGTSVQLSALTFDPSMQRVTLTASEELKQGSSYVLGIRYKGILNDKLAGFYRSTYTDKATGEKKTMAVTQFEATDARRALPCWDEPSVKARFSVTLYASSDVRAISNMPLVDGPVPQGKGEFSFPGDDIAANKQLTRLPRDDEQVVVHRFDRSPVMSTYLLAWIIGEFDYVESKSCGVDIRVYTPVGESAQGQFALDLSTRCLEFYNNWFGIPYPLPKLDMAAIPDFAAGAMENWGLLTYRHTKILIGPDNSAVQKQGASRTICHEIAHQWFGNLVTMEWWDDLWLNEGFARFMEFLAVDALFPEWKIWDSFVNEVFAAAQRLDALETSHPIHVSAWSPEQISEIFDAISYAKGGSVLRMLVFYLGEQSFQKGLQLYLTRHQYGNARSSDLWKALEDAQTGEGQKPVARVMDGWIHATGYPLLTVSRSAASPQKLAISQTRYLSSGTSRSQAPWVVPLTLTSYPQLCSLFETAAGELDLPSGASVGPLKLNVRQSGFYRVQYSEDMLEEIFRGIESLSASDKLGLQNDLFALSQSGHISTAQWLARLKAFFEPDMNYFVLSSICANLRTVCKLNAGQDYFPKLQSFIISCFVPIFEEIGWTNPPKSSDPHIFVMARAEVIGMLALADYPPVVAECRRLFVDGSSIVPDLRGVVYATAVRLGESKEYERALSLYESTETAAEKMRCLSALGLSTAQLQRSLNWGVEQVRVGDAPFLFGSIASTSAGRKAAWDFLKHRWSTITTRFPPNNLADIVGSVVSGFSDEEVIPDIMAFFAANPCAAADRTIRQGVELISSQAARRVRDQKALTTFFASK